MKWEANIVIGLASVSTEEIKKHPDMFKKHFKDLDNPTTEEIERYLRKEAERQQENYAGSNDGSEILANADIEITSHE